MINVNILIEQFSTPDDRKALVDAFARSGQDGLVRVLEDMKSKGRVRFASGGVGNDVKYIMELPLKTGADSVSSRIASLPSGSYTLEHVRGTTASAPSSCS